MATQRHDQLNGSADRAVEKPARKEPFLMIDPDPADPDPSGCDPRIHLIAVKPAGDEFVRFEARLAILAARYIDTVRVTLVTAGEGDDDGDGSWPRRSTVLPTVVLMRAGRMVGEAIGDLPLRELDEVVRAAATWPATAEVAA
ncbi:MAG: hypothetical protein IT370_09895 [Deltaproteobacteria bacterium]|nr:hypothetical protein [Deltaproteobacteria bacterium]